MEHPHEKQTRQNTAFKTVSMMIVITLTGKILGLVRSGLIASHYGTDSVEGTAVAYATMLPNVFMDVMFAAVVSASFIPVFNLVMQKDGKDAAFELSRKFISLILIVSTAVTAVLMLFAGQIITAYDAGATPGIMPMAGNLLRAMLPIIILSCAAFSLTGILQSMGEFNIPAAMALVSNAVILVYLIFFMDRFGAVGLCAAFLLGWAAQLVIQLPWLVKNKFGFRFRFLRLSALRGDEGLKQIAKLAAPVMISTWVAPVNLMVNGMAAVRSADGSRAYNALNYANSLYAVITGVIILSISNMIFPKLAALDANNDEQAFGDSLKETLRVLLFLLIPMALGLIAVSKPFIRVYYERNNFDAASTNLTSAALSCFAAGMPGFGLQTVLSRAFYAKKEGKTPLYTGLAAMAANLALSFLFARFVRVGGAGGPALASSVSMTAVALVMLWVMARRNRRVVDKEMLGDTIKIFAAGGVMFAAAVGTRVLAARVFGDSLAGQTLTAVLPVLTGIAVYMPLTFALGLPEAKTAFNMLRRNTSRQ